MVAAVATATKRLEAMLATAEVAAVDVVAPLVAMANWPSDARSERERVRGAAGPLRLSKAGDC